MRGWRHTGNFHHEQVLDVHQIAAAFCFVLFLKATGGNCVKIDDDDYEYDDDGLDKINFPIQ